MIWIWDHLEIVYMSKNRRDEDVRLMYEVTEVNKVGVEVRQSITAFNDVNCPTIWGWLHYTFSSIWISIVKPEALCFFYCFL